MAQQPRNALKLLKLTKKNGDSSVVMFHGALREEYCAHNRRTTYYKTYAALYISFHLQITLLLLIV